MGNLETNGPTWSRSPASWTRGWGLNYADIPFQQWKRVYQLFAFVLPPLLSFPLPCLVWPSFCSFFLSPSSFLPFPSSFFFFSLFIVDQVKLLCLANMAHSSDYVRTAPDRSRSRDEPMWHNRNQQHRSQYRDAWHEVPPVPRLRTTWTQFVHSWTNSMTTSWIRQRAMCCQILAEMKNLLCSPTISCFIHIKLKQSRWTPCWATSANTGTRGIATCILLPWSTLARSNWRYFCPSQQRPPDWTSPWISSSLDWRSGIWNPISEQHSLFYVSLSAIHHAHELPWGSPQPQHASIMRIKVTLLLVASSWFLFRFPISNFSNFATSGFFLSFFLFITATCVISQLLASVIIWQSVIPVSPVSPHLGHRRACNVVIFISRVNPAVALHFQVKDLNLAALWATWLHNPFQG